MINTSCMPLRLSAALIGHPVTQRHTGLTAQWPSIPVITLKWADRKQHPLSCGQSYGCTKVV